MLLRAMTYKQLYHRMDKGPAGRSKGLTSNYDSAVAEDTIVFVTFSKVDGRPYFEYVKFMELPTGMKNKNEIKKFLSNVDIKVFCTCPAFKYYCAYTASKKGVNTGDPDTGKKERRPPTVRKPQGPACKHLGNVLRILPFNWNKIIDDLASFNEDMILEELGY